MTAPHQSPLPPVASDLNAAYTPKPPKGKDLDSSEHRLVYTFESIEYLLKALYRGAYDIPIDTLTTFMNRCIPPEKFYDGREVSEHIAILGERKQLIYTKEGGVQFTMPPPP